MSKNTFGVFVAAIGFSLMLTACQDTKTLQENQQLKAQVAQLQKENGQLGNDIEAATAARDALTKENTVLQAEVNARKKKRSPTKASTRKHRRGQKAQQS